MSSFSLIEHQQQHTVHTLWFNRPEVRNAFNDELIDELTTIFQQLNTNPQVRVIVLAARGSTFCAGADLQWMKRVAAYSPVENKNDALRLAHLLQLIDESPKPVIARVQGNCFAGGVGLVAACDAAIATANVQFCLSEVKLGLVPATISPYLIRAMGLRQANYYSLTASTFNASTALELGLVQTIVPAESNDAALDTAVTSLTQQLLNNSPQAIAHTKKLFAEIASQPITETMRERTAQTIADARASSDGQEGLQAFFAKRKPRWCDE